MAYILICGAVLFFLCRGAFLWVVPSALVWFGLWSYLPLLHRKLPPVPCVSVSTLYSETYLHV